MAPQAQTYKTVRRTDSQLVRRVAEIAKAIGASNINITPVSGLKNRVVAVESVDDDGWLKDIFAVRSRVFHHITTGPDTPGITVTRPRNEPTDNVNINFGNQLSDELALKLVIAAHEHLPEFGTEDVRELLGDKLDSFYRTRDENLSKLEDLSQRLIEQNTAYRRQLDEENERRQEELEKRFEGMHQKMVNEYELNNKELSERSSALEEKEQELDDRSSRHARREDRQVLKRELANRSKSFSLTRETSGKRNLIHGVFAALFLLSIVFVYFNATKVPSQDSGFSASWWIYLARTMIGVAAAGATAVFYIRWNDQWFRSHADEEFRLRRLELDIDRASWVVELAMEWKEAKGEEIPEELFRQLTKNLFQESSTEMVRHPSEDLMEAISGLKLQVPGVGEATVTPRGMRRFKKAREEATNGK